MLTIQNNGPLLVSTNYWATEHARRGLLYLSRNAGTLRLLVPAPLAPAIVSEIASARRVVIRRDPSNGDNVLIVFDDATDNPFAVSLHARHQVGGGLGAADRVPFVVYTEAGAARSFTAAVVV